VDLTTTLTNLNGQQLATAAAVAGGVTVALVLMLAAFRGLRRAAGRVNPKLMGAYVLTAGLGVGTLAASFFTLWELTGSPWLGLFIDTSIVVFMYDQLVLEPMGKRVPLMNGAQWVILAVTMAANGSNHDNPAVAALHACMPLILKIAMLGLKAMIAQESGVVITDRVPLQRWIRDFRSAWWISHQIALNRVPSYAAACELDNRVAMQEILLRRDRADAAATADPEDKHARRALKRAPSARDLALLEVLSAPAPEPKRRATKPSTSPAPPAQPSRSAPAPARPTPAAALGGPAAEPEGDRVAAAATPLRLTVAPSEPSDVDEAPPAAAGDREDHLAELQAWLDARNLEPTGDNVAEAARDRRLPYAKRTAALAAARDLKQRRAAVS